MIVATPTSPTTFTARPMAAFVVVCVRLIVGVVIRAMSLCQISSPHYVAALYVHLVADWFQMAWVNARRIAAEMVKFSIIGNIPYNQSVSKCMCHCGLTSKRGVPITLPVFIACPNPTGSGLVHFSPEGYLVLSPTMPIDKTPRWSSLLSAATFTPHGAIITHASQK